MREQLIVARRKADRQKCMPKEEDQVAKLFLFFETGDIIFEIFLPYNLVIPIYFNLNNLEQ